MLKLENKNAVAQPAPKPTPVEKELRKTLRLELLEQRMAPGIIYGN